MLSFNDLLSKPWLVVSAHKLITSIRPIVEPVHSVIVSKLPSRDVEISTIALQPTNICNAKCTFCGYRKDTTEKGIMSMETFERFLLTKPTRIQNISFTGTVGEPMLDPTLFEKIRYARLHNPHGHLTLTSNGTKLNDYYKLIPTSGLDELFISIAGFDRENYKTIYGIDRAEEIRLGLLKLLALNESAGFPLKRIHLYFRNSLSPHKIVTSDTFKPFRKYLGSHFTISFVLKWDSWAGMVTQDEQPDGIVLAKNNYANVKLPCEALTSVLVRWNGMLRICGCRFKGTDNDDLTVCSIFDEDPFEMVDKVAKEWGKKFCKGIRATACKDCTLYRPFHKKL